jgi:hypothetical protein
MVTTTPAPSEAPDSGHQLEALPETAQVTATLIRGWREAGYRVSEQRVASWLHLIVRGAWESAVYKVIGPVFPDQNGLYRGVRIA